VYIFGGDRSTTAPYVDTAGGVQFVGSTTLLQNAVDNNVNSAFMIDGTKVFGAISSQVQGTADLTPSVDANTRIADLRGATNRGVHLSSIVISNGSTNAMIDLSADQSLGDVVNTINQAGVPGVTASIDANGHSITLTPAGSETISVVDVANGTSAADLGIKQATPAGAGVTVTGSNVNAAITPLTTLASLRDGAGIDTASGFTITNGGASDTIDLSGAVTVEDLLNKLNASDTGVRAEINASGTGINVLNPTQGTDLRISENGGTTAADLGLRSLTPTTPLADLNGGKGVGTVTGDDLTITRTDGTTFGVDLSGAITIQDVIDKINTADGGNGTTASFSSTGNGIVITDTAGGAGSMGLTSANFSTAAADLGLLAPPSGNAITGSDTNPIRSNGIFSDLAKLRAALQSSNTAQITEAAEGLKDDQERVIVTRGTNGAKLQELTARTNAMADKTVATQSMLSDLEDTNYTDAITRFQTLQTALQAAMQTGAAQLNMSLLDFLS
jgi:flagellin-like hook-associated protein FlgL